MIQFKGKIQLASVALLIVLLALLPIGASAESLTTLRLAQFGKSKFLLYLPLYVADEEGYLGEEGIKLEVSFAGNDDQVFATLVSGSADLAVGDPVFTAIAAERGFAAKTIALLVRKLAVYGYAKHGTVAAIKAPDDLKGLRIGSFPAPSTTYTLLSELNRAHRLSPPLTLVEGMQGTQFPMLVSGAVDIGIDLEPAVSVIEARGYDVVFDMTAFSDAQAVTGIMTTSKLIAERPQQLRGMIRAVNRALAALKKDPTVGYRTAIKLYPDVAPDVLRRAVDRLLASGCFPESALIPDDAWQRSLKTRLDSKELKQPQLTTVAVDNQFSNDSAK